MSYDEKATAFSTVAHLTHKTFSPKTIIKNKSVVTKGDPVNVFQFKNELLGWVPKEGSWRIVMSNTQSNSIFPEFHDWNCEFFKNGERFSGYQEKRLKRKTIWIFGESWMQGWALDDSLTFAFQLQGLVSEKYKVRSFANGSWGTLQALRLINLYQNEIKKDDIVMINFADWIMVRNLPSPTVINSILENKKNRPELYQICVPMFDEIYEKRLTKILELDKEAEIYAKLKDPSYAELSRITKILLSDIQKIIKQKLAILLVDDTSDEMYEYIKNNFHLIDARPSKNIWQKDTVLPYDAHPGPISNNFWAHKVNEFIKSQNEKN